MGKNKYMFLAAGFIAISLLFSACAITQNDIKASVLDASPDNGQDTEAQSDMGSSRTIGAAEAESLISKNSKNGGITIIDVRTPQEHAENCLRNSVNIDFSGSDFNARISKLDKNKAYLVYCRSGKRSAGAFEAMQKMGFSNVYNLYGGITGWETSGEPVETSC